MLTVEDLIKDYSTGFLGKKTRVLKGVTFSVNEGEIFGFVGPNGAGKTTTFKSILGFVTPTSGNITIFGKDSNDVSLKSKLGYLPESPYFYDYLTGEELLQYMGRLHGLANQIIKERAENLLDKVGLSHAKKLQLRKYSKGMLQRIGIAQSLINDPEFLILDEPMSGLDPLGRREIRDLILEQKDAGKTILLSSHILADIESLCDRVGVILEGTVVSTGILADLLKEIKTDYEMLLDCDMDVLIEAVDSAKVKMEGRAGFIVLRFDESEKNNVLEKILQIDAEIVSLYPVRKSLEGLFVEQSRKRENSVSAN